MDTRSSLPEAGCLAHQNRWIPFDNPIWTWTITCFNRKRVVERTDNVHPWACLIGGGPPGHQVFVGSWGFVIEATSSSPNPLLISFGDRSQAAWKSASLLFFLWLSPILLPLLAWVQYMVLSEKSGVGWQNLMVGYYFWKIAMTMIHGWTMT